MDFRAYNREAWGREVERGDPLEFSHTLEYQIDAGFVIAGFCEDRHRDAPLAAHMPTYIATRAIK
jgi:hypothetical protein